MMFASIKQLLSIVINYLLSIVLTLETLAFFIIYRYPEIRARNGKHSKSGSIFKIIVD